MKFPIDIIWIHENKIVGFEENIDPQIGANSAELKVYYPGTPVERVLELSAGRAKILGAKIGDNVMILPFVRQFAAQN